MSDAYTQLCNAPVDNRAAVLAAVAAVRVEFAQLTAERDRARSLAARLQQIAQAREDLLWRVIGEAELSHAAQMLVGRDIARHLRETAFLPAQVEIEARGIAEWMRDS